MKKPPAIIKNLRKQIEKDWGVQCKAFAIGCCGCQAHLALVILEELYDMILDMPMLKKARKHPKK